MSKKIDWQYHIAAQAKSNLAVAPYCKEYCISTTAFYYHRRNSKKPEPAFTELSVKERRTEDGISFTFHVSPSGRVRFEGSTSNMALLRGLFEGSHR